MSSCCASANMLSKASGLMSAIALSSLFPSIVPSRLFPCISAASTPLSSSYTRCAAGAVVHLPGLCEYCLATAYPRLDLEVIACAVLAFQLAFPFNCLVTVCTSSCVMLLTNTLKVFAEQGQIIACTAQELSDRLCLYEEPEKCMSRKSSLKHLFLGRGASRCIRG